jgi:hypothetical protein
MSRDLAEFAAFAHSMPLAEFLAQHGGFYLVKTDQPEGVLSLFGTEVKDFSRSGAPLRSGAEVIRLHPAADAAGLRVGRGPGCEVVLRDASVSRLHARIRLADGRVEVVDQRSRNGTRVNGVQVAPDEPVAVVSDTIVHFGNVATVVLDAESLYEQA